jgi:hypothetical protein
MRPPREETNMARTLTVLLLVLSASVLFAVACDNEDDFLLEDTGPDATGTPPFFQRTPLPSPEPSPEGSPLVEGATPVTPFEVTIVGINRRSEPSTEATTVDTPPPGDTATVVAEVPGEEVDEGNAVWYQLDDGSFVYSGVVEEVEE